MSRLGYEVDVDALGSPSVVERLETRRVLVTGASGLLGAGVARAGLWGAVSDYAATADAQICVILQIESRAGLAAIEEIAAVEGVDGLFVGPADLAADMGFGPRPEAPEVRAAVFDALRRIRAAGCVAGVYAAEEAFAAECRAAGATMIAAGADLAVLEAMKMEHVLQAPQAGRVQSLAAAPGDYLAQGQALLVLAPAPDAAVAASTEAAPSGWRIEHLASGHWPMLSHRDEVVDLIARESVRRSEGQG